MTQQLFADTSLLHDTPVSPTERRLLREHAPQRARRLEPDTPANLGAVYTPDILADWLASQLLRQLDLSVPQTILDPACGDGALLRASWKALGDTDWGASVQLVGVDISSDALSSAREKLPDQALLCRANGLAPARAKSASASWQTFLSGLQVPLVTAIIANPPWGAELTLSRSQLQQMGYALAQGQFDSYELFIEACLRFADDGSVHAFIVPDSLLLPEHRALREMLLRETELLLIARLGEGFFSAVFRGATVLVFRKGSPRPDHAVECFRLTKEWRDNVLAGRSTLDEAQVALSHPVLQSRFSQDPMSRFDIDVRRNDEGVLGRITERAAAWTKWLVSGRGVELSKHGEVLLCPRCQSACPLPRPVAPAVSCRSCGNRFATTEAKRQGIVERRDSQEHEPERWRPLIVGEDVDRYICRASRQVKLGVSGVNYKAEATFTPTKLLVRKTGVGLKAALDTSGAYTNQVVFHYFADSTRSVPDFYLSYVQGVLCSRVLYAYHLKSSGENEWRSHPYVTQHVLASLPIPEITSDPQQWRQAQAIAHAVGRRRQVTQHDGEEDIEIERLVAGLYGLDEAGCAWVLRVLDEAQSLEPVRTLRLSNPRAFKPVLA